MDRRETRILDDLGMKEVGELADAVCEAGSWPRVVAVAVDGDDRDREVEGPRALRSLFDAEAAGAGDDELRSTLDHRIPGGSQRALAGSAEHVDTTCRGDHLGQPMSGAE